MSRLKLLADGILYRNPNPGIRAECAYQPNVIALSDTEVICFYRIGSAFYAPDGKLAKLRSTDGGRTWEIEGTERRAPAERGDRVQLVVHAGLCDPRALCPAEG